MMTLKYIFHASMYLVPDSSSFQRLQSHRKGLKCKLTSTILQERENNQEMEQIASQSEPTTHSCAEKFEYP